MQLLPALENGGVERSTLEIADALVAAGHRSVVISDRGRLLPALRATGSEHIELALGRKSLLTLRHVFRLRRLFIDLKPQVVHARSRLPAWLAWLALRGPWPGPKPHLVTTMHGLNSPGWYSSIMTRGERVICVSESVRQHVLRHWPSTPRKSLVVIERGIDPTKFTAAPPATLTSRQQALSNMPELHGEYLLLLPGRGTRLKGHREAISLLAELRQRGRDVRLWLPGARESGRGRYVSELVALARSLSVAKFVHIGLPSSDMVGAYAQCDVVLQLSGKPEAFGRTVVEALSCARPVIGWAHGGVGELLMRYFPEGAVPLNETQALLDRVETLLDRPIAPSLPVSQSLAFMQQQTLDVYESFAA